MMGSMMPDPRRSLTAELAERLAWLALECVHREYPNKISHILSGYSDARSPRQLTPAFYGCYDWHSAVHNHWLLARVARMFPDMAFARVARESLQRSLTPENIQGEVDYLAGAERQSFERPYGLSWLLQLVQELDEWKDPAGQKLAADLLPLEQLAIDRLESWLPLLPHPVRTGEHNQTAFALGLMIDYARHKKSASFLEWLIERAHHLYYRDKDWPLNYEPSGEDFFSPGLAEADVIRRMLPPPAFGEWLSGFLPRGLGGMRPVISPDRSDPKFSHLDGLNLSRAWMLEGIASGLRSDDPRAVTLQKLADAHAEAGLAALAGNYYVGSHWLGTFAVYLLTRRGISLNDG